MGMFSGKNQNPDDAGFEGLEELENDPGLSAGQPPMGFTTPSRRRGPMALLLVLLVAGLGGGYYYVTSKTSSYPQVDSMALSTGSGEQGPAAPVLETSLAIDAPTMPGLIVPQTAEDDFMDDPLMGFDPAATPPSEDIFAEENEAEVLEQDALSGVDFPANEEALTFEDQGSGVQDVSDAEFLSQEEALFEEAPPVLVNDEVMIAPAVPSQPASQAPVDPLSAQPTLAELAMIENRPPPAPVVVEPLPVQAQRAVRGQELGERPTPPRPVVEQERPREERIRQAPVHAPPPSYLTVRKDKSVDSPDARLVAARRALTDGRDQAALQIFEDLYAQNPLDTRVLLGRAVSLQRLGEFDRAIAAYEETLSRDPSRVDALTNYLGLLRQQSPTLALAKLEELRSVYPANAAIAAQLGVSYGDVGRNDDAMRVIDIAISLAPHEPIYQFNKAVMLDRMGRRGDAVRAYQVFLQMAAESNNPDLPVEAVRQRLETMP